MSFSWGLKLKKWDRDDRRGRAAGHDMNTVTPFPSFLLFFFFQNSNFDVIIVVLQPNILLYDKQQILRSWNINISEETLNQRTLQRDPGPEFETQSAHFAASQQGYGHVALNLIP